MLFEVYAIGFTVLAVIAAYFAKTSRRRKWPVAVIALVELAVAALFYVLWLA